MKKVLIALLSLGVASTALAEGSWSGPTREEGMQVTQAKHTGTIRPITDFCYDASTDTFRGEVPVYKKEYVLGGGLKVTKRQAMYKDNVREILVRDGSQTVSFPGSFTTETYVCRGAQADTDNGTKSDWYIKNYCDKVVKRVAYKRSGTVNVIQKFKDHSDMERVIDSYDWEVKSCGKGKY